MFQLVYVSSATQDFSKQDLLNLLEKARINNTRLGVTGLLLYKEGNFIQVLEGEEAAVKTTYEKVTADRRHAGTLVLMKGPVARRDFEGWSMGFRDLNSPEVHALPGYSEFLNEPTRPLSDPSRAAKLLAIFKSRM